MKTKNNIFASFSEKNSSEIRRIVTLELFEVAFEKFLEQADANAVSKLGKCDKTPYGFSNKIEFYTKGFKLRYGSGRASHTPYMNWWVVSIYYLPSSGRIYLAIEEDRYLYLDQLRAIKSIRIGNKKVNVSVFFECDKKDIDYKELHMHFINVAEDVINCGIY